MSSSEKKKTKTKVNEKQSPYCSLPVLRQSEQLQLKPTVTPHY